MMGPPNMRHGQSLVPSPELYQMHVKSGKKANHPLKHQAKGIYSMVVSSRQITDKTVIPLPPPASISEGEYKANFMCHASRVDEDHKRPAKFPLYNTIH